MRARIRMVSGLIVIAATTLVCLALSSETHGQTAAEKKAAKAAQKAAKEAAKAAEKAIKEQEKAAKAAAKAVDKANKAQRNLTESDLLERVYLVLEGTNANYDGHRAKALNQIKTCINRLDRNIMNNGTDAQKLATYRDECVDAYCKHLRRELPAVIETQFQSDAAVYMSGVWLAQLKPIFVANNQNAAVENIDNALREINLCLIVR